MSDADIRDLETEIIASTTGRPDRMVRWTMVIALLALFGTLAVWATSTSSWVGIDDRVDKLEKEVAVLQEKTATPTASTTSTSDTTPGDVESTAGDVEPAPEGVDTVPDPG